MHTAEMKYLRSVKGRAWSRQRKTTKTAETSYESF